MYTYNNYNLMIESFSDIRTLRESELDLDLIIDLDNRVVNFYLEEFPEYIIDRFQFTKVKSLVIRISKEEYDNSATLHLLRSIDLNTPLVNFSLNYENIKLILLNKEFNIDFIIKKCN